MGIEPTGHMISMQPDGFEDRGQHQLNKHFHSPMLVLIEVSAVSFKIAYPQRTPSLFS